MQMTSIETRPEAEVQYELALKHYNNGQYADALLTFESALGADSASAAAHSGRGAALYNLACYQEALSAFEQALKLDPTSAAVCYNRGVALYCLKRYRQALGAFEQTLLLDASFTAAYHGRRRIFSRRPYLRLRRSRLQRLLAH